ncbi:LuxR family transcriptional regulator [Arthrobacter sp. BE255]|uniref:helix-turn-helix transcriptional regulator n=1 Tax=Arthrobacter sp. BE255 TaxID=2817721 RepID=UPI00285E3EF5|nr:LuxR family transcriptional regulator [Arthrobacter sp. BE255]MDR7160230.1 DNA-binding CsgD family transcriptional regulator [Arthrobacter sp. BE255]
MITGWGLTRSLERIRALGGSTVDHQSLRAEVLAEVGRVVPFDAFVWPLCDPVTATGVAPRARIPCPEELPLLIRLKYLSRQARWTGLARSASPASTLLRDTGGDPSRSPLWDGVMKRYGVADVLSVVFADKYGYWGWLDLWRVGSNGAFSESEAGYLAGVAGELTPLLRRSIASQFGPPDDVEHGRTDAPATEVPSKTGRPRNVARLGELPPQAVLTLDEDLAVVGETASTSDWLELLQPGPRPYQAVPAEVLNVAAQLLAREAGVDDHDAAARVHLGSGRWAFLRASRMASGVSGATPPLAVTIQECPPGARLDMFARCFGLTPRQRELLELASAGASTAAMAASQGTSAYTVQDQFKQIFENCGVRTRASLLAMALGIVAGGSGPRR